MRTNDNAQSIAHLTPASSYPQGSTDKGQGEHRKAEAQRQAQGRARAHMPAKGSSCPMAQPSSAWQALGQVLPGQDRRSPVGLQVRRTSTSGSEQTGPTGWLLDNEASKRGIIGRSLARINQWQSQINQRVRATNSSPRAMAAP